MAGRDGDYRQEAGDDSDMDADLDPEIYLSRQKDKGKGRANPRVQKLKAQPKEVSAQPSRCGILIT